MPVKSRSRSSKPLELAVEIALRTALFGLPTPDELRVDYDVSRATAYRYHSLIRKKLGNRSVPLAARAVAA